jgi:peptide/nickel transport system permease protein
MPKLVFLATDIALYLLVVVIVFYVWHALRTPTLRQTWRSVLHDPAAMSAGVVLAIFLVIAMLDSFHFRPLLAAAPGAAADASPAYSTRTLSVLDALLAGPRESREKTYSVPLGTHQYSKESMLVDGKSVRDFPRLQFGGTHVKNTDADWAADAIGRSIAGLVGGALAAALLWLVVAFLRARSTKVGVVES